MKILLTGATGFVGRALAQALLAQGHQLLCPLREPARLSRLAGGSRPGQLQAVPLDFAKAVQPADWQRLVAGVDVVVNAAGIFKEAPGQGFDVLHTHAPVALFEAAAAADVRLIVQISALGADAQAQSRFHLSKRAADDHLRGLGRAAWVVQPSLIYGAGGASAELFNALATLPVLVLPRLEGPGVQPVLLDDVVQGVVNALCRVSAPTSSKCREADLLPGCQTVAFVGPQAMPLCAYLARLRCALGWPRPALGVVLPLAWVRAVARHLPRGGFLDADTLAMLARGNTADSQPFAALLGRELQAVEAFVAPEQTRSLRQAALLAVWKPLLRWSVAFVWIWTGVVSLGLYPPPDSLALLARVGAHGALAWLLLYGAAWLDLALGVVTLVLPWLSARARRRVWGTQVLLIVAYTAVISVRLPEFWLHPYGPVLKNLPLLAAIGLLWSLEAPAGRRQ